MKKFFILWLGLFVYFLAIGQVIPASKESNPGAKLAVPQLLPAATVITETRTCDCDPPKPGFHFNPFTGNVHREIRDLEVWGGVGDIPLVLKRYGNSVGGKIWDVSFNYSMVDTGVNTLGQPQIVVHYPDGEGGEINAFAQNTPSLWLPQPGVNKRLFQYGNDFFLQMANGYRYHFEKLPKPGGYSYKLRDFADSYQNIYTVAYDTISGVPRTRITEPAGRYIEINYGLIGGNYVITSEHTSDGRTATFYNRALNDGIKTWTLLDSVRYGDGTRAVYTYQQFFAGSPPNLEHPIDPRYEGAATNIIYGYLTFPSGFIKEEKNGVTGELMVSLNASSDNKTVCYANGRTQVYNMPSNQVGLVNSYKDGSGAVAQYAYANSGTGFRTSQTDALGRTTTYNSITVYGNPLEVTYPDGTKEKWTRDTLDLPLTHTDELGRVTTYTRDSRHRPTRIDYADGTFETFTYNTFGQVLDHGKKNGGVEHYAFDSRGLNTSFTDALGKVKAYSYDAFDKLKTVTDARNNTTSYEYNERGLITKQTNADASFRTYTYDSLGNRTTVTDELAHTWTTAYDIFHRPKTKSDPLNRTITYAYDLPGGVCGCTHADNKPTKIILPTGKVTLYSYDLEWRKIKQTVGAGSSQESSTFLEYNIVGNMVAMIDPSGKQWAFGYDLRDRRTTSIDPLGNITQNTYDGAGNVLTVKRPDNGLTTNVYDNLNRKTQVTDPKGQVTKMTYDGDGNLVKLTDAKNNQYAYNFDLIDRKTKVIYPDGTLEVYTYDPVNNIATFTNRANNIKTYTYDNRNRETGSTWSDNTPAITRIYDNAGRLLTLTSNVSALNYAYNVADELISETQAIAGAASKTIKYFYNADGLRDSVGYAGGTGVKYSYNGRNQLASLSTAGALPLVSYTYDLNGNAIGKALNNGTNTIYAYDDANRMLMVDNQQAGSSFARFDYGYDNVNRRKYVKRENNKGDVYAYDAIDQVTDVKYDVTGPDGSALTPARTVNYGLDALGNRTTVTDNGTTSTYAVNNLNQFTTIDGSSLTYSPNGSLQTFNGWNYTYDAENRLVKATKGTTVVDLAYDPQNRCVKRSFNGIASLYYYDYWNLIEERNSSDALQQVYIHGARVDEIITKISPASSVYYQYDALGNVVKLTNKSGVVVEQYEYDVFGAATIRNAGGSAISSSGFDNRFMFTGREFIQEIDLYDYRFRMYSQKLGRFLQTDPILFKAGDLNLYRYVGNNPINYVDPTGKSWRCAVLFATLVIAVTATVASCIAAETGAGLVGCIAGVAGVGVILANMVHVCCIDDPADQARLREAEALKRRLDQLERQMEDLIHNR